MSGLRYTDKVLDAGTFLLLAGSWIYLLVVYPSLPSVVPTHFNLEGQADDFGSKSSLWVLPAVATAVCIGLTLLSRIPHKFNYPVQVNPENAARVYTATVRLLRVIRFLVVLIFSSLVYFVCAGAKSGSFGLSAWFVPAVAGTLMAAVGIYLVQVTKNPGPARRG